nr:MAG TPA: hypothetical protein [Caudoviricetes sp.]
MRSILHLHDLLHTYAPYRYTTGCFVSVKIIVV